MKRHLDRRALRDAIASRGFRLKRRLGQNFLLDRGILDFITSAGEVGPQDLVLEVGGGPGFLTQVLLESGARVISVEKDPGLKEIGHELLLKGTTDEERERLHWINVDFLERKEKINPKVESLIQQELKERPDLRFKVISNLPYCIATPAIVNLLESGLPWKMMVLTIQQEVADRFTAKPGSPDYGQLSVIATLWAEIRKIRKVKAGTFWPQPDVDSCIIEFLPRQEHCFADFSGYKNLKEFTRAIFAHRRKTWLKSLKLSYKSLNLNSIIAVLEAKGINTGARAQDLDIEDIKNIYSFFPPILSP